MLVPSLPEVTGYSTSAIISFSNILLDVTQSPPPISSWPNPYHITTSIRRKNGMWGILEGYCPTLNKAGIFVEGRGKGEERGRQAADSVDQEQAMSNVYRRPALVHSGVPTPSTVPGTW